MKILILTLTIAFALVTPPRGLAQATDQGRPLTPEQELKALDLSWHQAVAARDADTLGRLLAEDYHLHLDAAKMLTKAQEVEAVRGSEPLFEFGRFKLDNVTARVEGGRATVSGILTARPNGGDKKSRRRYFYTRTFVNADGRWQVLGARLVTLWPDSR
jgi:ketosteroid isomerase-like protein